MNTQLNNTLKPCLFLNSKLIKSEPLASKVLEISQDYSKKILEIQNLNEENISSLLNKLISNVLDAASLSSNADSSKFEENYKSLFLNSNT
jgi:hypothetical protein